MTGVQEVPLLQYAGAYWRHLCNVPMVIFSDLNASQSIIGQHSGFLVSGQPFVCVVSETCDIRNFSSAKGREIYVDVRIAHQFNTIPDGMPTVQSVFTVR